MKLKKILLVFSIFSFFQSLWAQKKEPVIQQDTTKITDFQKGVEKATAVIKKLIDDQVIPGLSITVTKKGHTIWEQGFGWADIENKRPVEPSKTLFRIASVSKPISAVGLAKLQENRILDWNCSVYEYVPNFPKKIADFTIKQLAGHLAGIRAYRGREVFSNDFMSIEEGLKMFQNDELLFMPGTKYLYNSFDWNLVGVAMEKAVHQPFEEYMKEAVFQPLNMSLTLPDRGSYVENQSIPYTKGKGFQKSTSVNNYYKLPGGGFLSTTTDVAKLGNAILSQRFLSVPIQQEMLASQCLDTGQETGYGIGWQSSVDWKNRMYYGHIGNGIGGYSWFYVYPEDEIVIVICMNITNPSIDEQIKSLIDAVLEGASYEHIEEPAYAL